VVEESTAPPERVLEAARDFSERRADLWPDVHVEYLEVHDRGETWAEVTEGNP
jgi:catechol 2,3-dioxygenase-like lactoylglutathione lyase family enzyme